MVESDSSDGTVDEAVMRPTLLKSDSDSGQIVGIDGGLDNRMNLALTYDTRDYEPDPSSGQIVSLSEELSSDVFGSTHNFTGGSGDYRAFLPVSSNRSLVAALRAQYSWKVGDVPFYEMNAIGGRGTLRGYRNSRFSALESAHASAEARWHMINVTWFDQDLNFVSIPFIDTGRVFDHSANFSTEGWKTGSGLALRMVWNQATIIGGDYSVTGEGNEIYVETNHAFLKRLDERLIIDFFRYPVTKFADQVLKFFASKRVLEWDILIPANDPCPFGILRPSECHKQVSRNTD